MYTLFQKTECTNPDRDIAYWLGNNLEGKKKLQGRQLHMAVCFWYLVCKM